MIVLDTNVVSELMRPVPDMTVLAWIVTQRSAGLVTTSITVAEVGYGVARLADSSRKAELALLADDVFSAFPDQVLSFDAAAALAYAQLVADQDRAGRQMNGFDAQIAAICLSQPAQLATRNSKAFTGTGVEITDPWVP